MGETVGLRAPFPHHHQCMLKRCLDVLCALVVLLAVSPIFVVIAVLIRVDSRGPAIYRRRVLGMNGVEFDAYKFRTMLVGADDALHRHRELWVEYQRNVKLKSDPRVTRVGRWLRRSSLDEFPQLLNVLRGEMSLVGPRIITAHELHRYGVFAAKRLSVRPGISGLWQVSGRQELSYDSRIRLDIQYIEHWSLWLDLKILLRTIPVVLRMQGAY